jgi:outer membrane lipoprotein-sorting protein
MKAPLDNDLNKAYEAFNQDHDHLRETLMASLPDSIKPHKQTGRVSHALAFTGGTIMRSRITKLAAAAVIIIAILTAIQFLGNPIEGIAWADVVRPILTARTVVFNVFMVEGENVPITSRVMNMGTQRFRSEVLSPDGKTVQVIVIVDYNTSEMLELFPKQKTAVLIELKDFPEKPKNLLETVRNNITELQNDPNFSVEPLGEKEIDGQIAKGFRATGPDGEMTVWADPETALPVRMEHKWRQMQFICTDFEFDVEMDESLFSMEIPEGYSALPKAELPIASSTEQDLIESLRIWAEVILDDVFPRDLSTQVYVDDVKKNRGKFATLQKEQKLELAMKMGPGFIFVQLLKAENDWHYVGKNVKLGDSESPVCWYRPEGSETYRVIYGDLSVKDVAPENLPK